MKIVSLFSGCGGMDTGFEQAGFQIVFANEWDKRIWKTYEMNHSCPLHHGDIREISSADIPDCDGIIGGPPCQSWSCGGAKRGIQDERGKLFFEYIRILKEKQPIFFVSENVQGMLSPRNAEAVEEIHQLFSQAGYTVSLHLINTADYGIPQQRKRIFFIGIRNDVPVAFQFPQPSGVRHTIKDAIYDLRNNAVPALQKNRHNPAAENHNEYYMDSYSSIYMSRNRRKLWDEYAFTIQASGRQTQLHPDSPCMEYLEKDKWRFIPGKEHLYRRLSVRECARIQTFPDTFAFYYDQLNDAYKMIGNAVPVDMAKQIAESIRRQLFANSEDIQKGILHE